MGHKGGNFTQKRKSSGGGKNLYQDGFHGQKQHGRGEGVDRHWENKDQQNRRIGRDNE